MAVDSSGNIYVVGTDSSGVIPNTVRNFQTSLACGPYRLCFDGFVMKLDSTGTKVLYATYLGGTEDDVITSVAVDAAGNAYVTGTTNSNDFPVTFDAASTVGSAFVTKLNPDGSINYSTYLGGSGTDTPVGIQVDRFGNAYVGGATSSSDFPTTYSAYRGAPGPGFVSKINATGTRFTYSTYFDAAAAAMALDGDGAIYLTGHTQSPLTTTPGAMQSKLCGTDCSFVSILNSNGSGLIYSSFLGGSAVTQASSIAVDPSGGIWVAGVTTATDFPSPSPVGGAFVVKINAPRNGISGSYLFGTAIYPYTLYLFMQPSVSPAILGFDVQGNAYVSSTGTPGSFSTTANALLAEPCSPVSTGASQVLLKLDSGSNALYVSFARQIFYEQVVLSSGRIQGIYADLNSGWDVSTPIDLTVTPQLNFGCPVNSASYVVSEGLLPGEIVSIFGSNLGPEAGATAQLDANGRVSTSLAGTEVLFNGIPAPLLYVASRQINTVVPFEAHGQTITIQIQRNGMSAPALGVPEGNGTPGVFTVSEQPGTQGLILNQDGTLNSPANPATLGSIISLFCTGVLGGLTPPEMDGQITPISPPPITLVQPGAGVTAEFAGVFPYGVDNVVWAGAAPGLVAGVTQLNVQLPTSLPSGTPLNAVPVSLIQPFSSLQYSSAPVLVSVAP